MQTLAKDRSCRVCKACTGEHESSCAPTDVDCALQNPAIDMADAGTGRYPKRARRQRSLSAGLASGGAGVHGAGAGDGAAGGARRRRAPCATPTGRVLVVHANSKEYGRGARGNKQSNRNDFAFSAADYVAMRDSCRPYPARVTDIVQWHSW